MATRTEGFGAILFHTTSAALRAERVLAGGGFTVKLIPTPREFSSDCGLALRFDWQDVKAVRDLLEKSRVPVAGVYRLGAY